jgi:hypothetical protein
MTFAESDLLLTAARLTQLKTALSNTGVTEPLTTRCIPEAQAEVARAVGDYAASDDELRSLIRRVALWNAYALVGPVPKDIQAAFEAARKELDAIREGRYSKPVAGAGGSAVVVTGTSARETTYNLNGL